MGLIYMRTSPSGGRYVGKTIYTEESRWAGHCAEARCSITHSWNIILNKAIRKYGEDNFSVEILEDNIPEDKLNDREIYWIENKKTYYLDNCHGYNMTRGGEGTSKFSHSKIIDLWNLGLSSGQICEELNTNSATIKQHLKAENISDEEISIRGHRIGQEKRNKTLILIREEQKKKFLKLWNENFTITQISEITKNNKELISKSLKESGITNEEINSRAIASMSKKLIENYQNNKDTKMIQQLWDNGLSVKEIKQKTCFTGDKIARALEYYNITKQDRLKRGAQQANKTRNKPVIQCDKNGEEIKFWKSAAQAGKELNIDPSSIRKAVKGTIKLCGGYKWKAAN